MDREVRSWVKKINQSIFEDNDQADQAMNE
jgi:hypothetical protein